MSNQHERPAGVRAVSSAFAMAAAIPAAPAHRKRKRPPPFSVRLTDQEKARLQFEAAGRPLGEFIRARVLGEHGQSPRSRRAPQIDDQKLAAVLAELGRSRLSSNLNQLAKSANLGTLDVSPELTRSFEEACRDVKIMREALLAALGLKTGGRQ